MTKRKLTILTSLALCCLGFGQEKDTKSEPIPLSQETWNKYFKLDHHKKNRTWKMTMMLSLAGEATTAKVIEKFKGEKDGWIHLASVIVGGPYDGQQNKRSLKVSEKGQLSRENDKEVIRVPFPLTLGQSWKRDDTTITFDRYEDYETPTQTISKCIVFTTKTKKETSTRWYSAEHGSFYTLKSYSMGRSITNILENIK